MARAVQSAKRRRNWALAALALFVVAGLVFSTVRLTADQAAMDSVARAQADAESAIEALHAGDRVALGRQLAAHRGDVTFAHRFASAASVRALGDALGEISDESHEFELVLTDLAGTLAVATHGAEEQALPASWTADFITATTNPDALPVADDASPGRAAQDQVNKHNLLLLLSRAQWSTPFLQEVTEAYWAWDHERGPEAWRPAQAEGARYAATSAGTRLADGMVALSAALTANPEASAWAFTAFRPGAIAIGYDCKTHTLGEFAHHLVIGRHISGATENAPGRSAVVTALLSAIEATDVVTDAPTSNSGPRADLAVIQGLVEASNDRSSCNLLDRTIDGVMGIADTVKDWAGQWGTTALDIVSFAPPPFSTLASVGSSGWSAIEGDYLAAGLALAAVIPGVAIGVKAAKLAGAGTKADEAVAQVDDIADVAAKHWPLPSNRELAEAGAARVTKSPHLFRSEADAQQMVLTEFPGAAKEVPFQRAGCHTICEDARRVDVYIKDTQTAIELKVGVPYGQHVLKEIHKDAALLADPMSGVKAVVWRFYPDVAGKVGPTPEVRRLLTEHGIPYEMYTP